MAKRFDGLIEAARYGANGQLLVVRAYERRGAAYSDIVMLDRPALIDRLKRRKLFVTGKRLYRMGGTFEIGQPVRLEGGPGQETITTGGQDGSQDHLEGVPIF